MRKTVGYFGSVRFFKNMILLAVIVMIAVPTGFAIHLNSRLRSTEQLLSEERETPADSPDVSQDAEADQLQMVIKRTDADIFQADGDTFQAESPYADLYPDFYAPQELSANVRETNVLYLTFDDGPSARTEEILDILAEKNVKATFFVVGFHDESQKATLQRMAAEGHTLAMHSYSHDYAKIYASVEDYLSDMYQVFSLIKETTGVTPTLFRFPGGSINGYSHGIYQELIAEMLRRGFVPFDWNISSQDAATNSLVPAETLVNNVVKGAANVRRGIVLMHDSAAKTTTVQALAPMIDRLQEQGFELKALTPEVLPVLYSYKE